MTREISWMDQPWTAFDTETSGVDLERDLILSAAVLNLDKQAGREFLIDWDKIGVTPQIAPEAAKVHGITVETLRVHGRHPHDVLEWVCQALSWTVQHGVIVGMNVTFDLTILDRNCRRASITTLSDRLGEIRPVADAFVLDKYVDPFRKGKRNLGALAVHYNATLDNAHNASSDALAAGRVLWRIGRMFPQIGGMGGLALHRLQVGAKVEQDASFKQYKVKQGQDASGLDGHWPIIPLKVEEPPW